MVCPLLDGFTIFMLALDKGCLFMVIKFWWVCCITVCGSMGGLVSLFLSHRHGMKKGGVYQGKGQDEEEGGCREHVYRNRGRER
uniref:Transmembrane protein n=1 Tax=Engystomops pustulosus TaxID=76066 RepID=A0AAV6YSA3_ENGPU|nr:hypothetical protein GDO81_023422 [Engystomops pustulosus]